MASAKLVVRTCPIVAAFAAVLIHSAAAATESSEHTGKVVWNEDFPDPQLPQWSMNYYVPPGGKEGRPEMNVKDGNLHFSSAFFAAPDVRGYASASYHFKNGGAGFKLIEAPVLEIRLRPLQSAGYKGQLSTTLVLNYATYGGDHMWTSFSPLPQNPAGKWVNVSYNLYDHPIASGPGGKKLLKDFAFFLQCDQPGEPTVEMEIDWIRLRQMTAEEYGKVAVHDELLTNFQMEPAPHAENFFGLGFYGLSCPRWGGGWPVSLDQLSRDWVNFMGSASGRYYQSVWSDHRSVIPNGADAELPEGEAARATVYVRTHKYLAPLLREYGIYYLANLVGFAGGVDTVKLADRDPDQLNRWADEITSGLRDEPNILGWFCADEAKPTYLKNYLVTKAMIESRDRSKASMVLLNNLGFLKGFHESHQVIFTDQYPVLRRNRDDPWNILKWMHNISELTGDKPHWFTTQAFYLRGQPWQARPGPADLKLMSWLAIAGGANVNCYFLLSGGPWWWHVYIRDETKGDHFWCTMDSYGNETPRYQVFREYAAKLGPIGPLLARASLDRKPRITAVAPEIKQNGFGPDATGTIKAVHVGVLRPAQVDGRILIVVNMDRDHVQPVTVTVPDAAGRKMVDLVSLREIPAAKPPALSLSNARTYNLSPLEPGDGHPYIFCNAREFEQVKSIVTATRARHARLIAKLDLRMATAWQADVAALDQKLTGIDKMLADGRPQQALEAAGQLQTAIEQTLKGIDGYDECRRTLKACRKDLGRIEVMMNVAAHGEKPKLSPALSSLAKEVLTASTAFDGAMTDFYAGKKKDALPARVKALQAKVTALVPTVSRETDVAPDYWPFPEKPWLIKFDP